ncbi:Atg7p [Nakaseomyces bracarensis]|uniref:Atg7p n=1 Tax=Nakaseomyces bracarensis TaxID=273131 RepID=UPI0038716FBA
MSTDLNFVPALESFLDTSFFQELSRLKLEEQKLDTKTIPLLAKLNIAQIPSTSNSVHLFLDKASFDLTETKLEPRNIYIHGRLYNCNTLEEFKLLNKQKYLADEAALLIESGKKDINKSLGFSILSFADLKKYKFYYWVCTPTFQIHRNFSLVDKSNIIDDAVVHKEREWFDDNQNNWVAIRKQNGSITPYEKNLDIKDVNALLVRDTSINSEYPSAFLKNILTIFCGDYPEAELLDVHLVRNKPVNLLKLSIRIPKLEFDEYKTSGWESNNQGKLIPRALDLSSLIDPLKVAGQSVDLNLKLMKWRIAPDINLEVIKNNKILLLGSGTLGCYVARSLMAWGCRKITFVDNGTVSLSNPVRQPLFEFSDVGKEKSIAAAEGLKRVFPLIDAVGDQLNVPMIGHPIKNEEHEHADYIKLVNLIESHDTIFLLMDSRETRWLPAVIGKALNKNVMNVALGFDSYLVIKHGNIQNDLGCYFCNDIVVPTDSISDRTLDQMCTVTRPGVAPLAASQAVELLVSSLQHSGKDNVLGEVPHQLRGFLSNFSTVKLKTPAYGHCSACSSPIIDGYLEGGWDFVKNALNNPMFIEDLCGLSKIKQEVEDMDLNDFDDEMYDDDDFEILE